jgi:hypothetical protein
MREKLPQVSGIVHIESDARKSQHLARFSRGVVGGVVWLEAVVAEA